LRRTSRVSFSRRSGSNWRDAVAFVRDPEMPFGEQAQRWVIENAAEHNVEFLATN
jgi:hypothetical protein